MAKWMKEEGRLLMRKRKRKWRKTRKRRQNATQQRRTFPDVRWEEDFVCRSTHSVQPLAPPSAANKHLTVSPWRTVSLCGHLFMHEPHFLAENTLEYWIPCYFKLTGSFSVTWVAIYVCRARQPQKTVRPEHCFCTICPFHRRFVFPPLHEILSRNSVSRAVYLLLAFLQAWRVRLVVPHFTLQRANESEDRRVERHHWLCPRPRPRLLPQVDAPPLGEELTQVHHRGFRRLLRSLVVG